MTNAGTRVSRRTIGLAMFAGYSAWALDAAAQPISTDETGLATELVHLPTAGSPIRAYIARPAGPGRRAALIVVNEVFGLHEYIRDVCRRLAKAGYVAIAPGFFDRAGDPAPLTDFHKILAIVRTASDAQVFGDLATTLAWLERHPFVDRGRIAITGFCWGGRWVWNACERFPELKAGAAWYGQLAPAPGGKPDPRRWWPIDHVASLTAPVLGLYGGRDPLSAALPAMRKALAAAGKRESEIILYPDAGHGFHADYRASYVAADARDGWARMLAFFARQAAPA